MKSRILNKYQQVLDRVEAAVNPPAGLIPLGTLDQGNIRYPLVKVTLGMGNAKRVLISAGIHGDEPAGVEALCAFLERKLYAPFLHKWEMHILPCINPTGYEIGTRENHAGEDLNRQFKLDRPNVEVACVQSVFETGPFDLDLELHEDVDSPGYYLYQKDLSPTLSDLGRRILDAVEPVMPLDGSEEIEDMPADRGLLARLKPPDEMEWWPMALYAYKMQCRHMFTMETSCQFPMKQRVEAHLKAVETALSEFPGKPETV
ncbi:M14 family metallopeptidase [Nitrospina watsonii]|uniref:Peptidase M14 domain-containing protein n=1 Tax=Nitrospina watsonii TaxID=1323948 RepID=A0ABN8VWY1_9BACT|nr:M14 family metallocarboxypeptidase [Nitrospina watsonii]CAI2718304.1 conserved protein of unknown function [Nitrospina watsonii]